MIQHEVIPTTETWASGQAQQYGWQHLANSEGVFGAYGHMLVARRAIPTEVTWNRVVAMKEAIDAEGCVVLASGVIAAADVVVANAMKAEGQICTDQEVWEIGLQVGIYILKPAVEVPLAA